MKTGKMNFSHRCITLVVIILVVGINFSLAAADIYLEAEHAELQGVQVAVGSPGYSGSGYVAGFDDANDRIVFNFSADAGLYELTIGFATPYGQKGYDLWVNGRKSTGIFDATMGSFSAQKAGKYLLVQGRNTLIIGNGWGWFYIDYIRLTSTQVGPPLKPPNQLINKNATGSTRALFSFLVEQYGGKILSGQYGLGDIQYIQATSGRIPAIGGFDLIDYSPSRIQFGANPQGSVENWIDWVKQDALITLMWHWNAPTDLINEPDKEWWRGFYTYATTFDLAAVLADKSSSRYQLLLRDMDAIAVQLKKFSDQDIPVLWRPLHEASGGWFWWGAKGASAYIELWRLMVDRFTNYHRINNLIWVCTHGDSAWYPGDAYVDIVGLDIYTDASSNMSNEWERAQREFNGRKLVALSESGTLPDPNDVRIYATWWSWFSVWTGSFIRDIDTDLLRGIYHHPDVMTRDELPEWRRYTYTDSSASRYLDRVEVRPNPCSKTATVTFVLMESTAVVLRVYDIDGRQVIITVPLNLIPGVQSLPLHVETLVSGCYFVSVEATGKKSRYAKFIVLH